MCSPVPRAARAVPLAVLAGALSALPAPLYAEVPARSPAAHTATAAPDRDATLAELLAHAAEHAPAVVLAARRSALGDAARTGADALLHHDPTLELGAGPRFEQGSSDLDLSFSLAQPVEVAGERGLRRDAAARLGDRLGAELDAARWTVRRAVVSAYARASVARARVELAARATRFAEDLLQITRRRLAAGDVSAIDLRVAEVDAAEARQAELAAAEELRLARLSLAEVTGWPIDAPPSVSAAHAHTEPVPPLADVLAQTEARHPELRAQRASVLEAEARAALADREAWPVPVLGVQVAREGSVEGHPSHIVLGTLGLPLPLWQANRTERAKSRAEVDLARAEEELARRALVARVARAHAALEAATARTAIYADRVVPHLADSLVLLRRALDAGELSIFTVAAARERFLAAERAALLAEAERLEARAELEHAAGLELASPAAPSSSAAPGGAS